MNRTKLNPLTVFIENGIWCVRDRGNAELISKCGTDTMPTSYRANVRKSVALAGIRRRNLGRTLEVLL